MTLVQRPDLADRTALSKSALTTFDLCQTQAWYQIHERRPLIPNERITFGSAVDAGVEQIATFLRAEQTVDMNRVMAAAMEVVNRDEVAIDIDEVERAAERFMVEVAPKRDWAFVQTQADLTTEFPDLGPANGHPDLIFRDNAVDDVKTAKRAKPDEPTLELGWYALLVEEVTAKPVPTVGYLTWVRVTRPYWQELRVPVTDELRRWSRARSLAYVKARRADQMWNSRKGAGEAENVSFPGGPKFSSLCDGCAYAPANGGPCQQAWRGESDANAA